ncbi:MAG TPA: AAC(3) family N-acetyltransferase [Pyrinomonadaceae bacterium]|nr:AAC(3) family N-acetyltransferase [Pyrinomonadaceae bacterium]
MDVTEQDLRRAVRALDLSGRAVCVHSSLRSFGRVEGGASGVVRAFLEEGCTMLAPTFSSAFAVEPPPRLRFERNGWDYVRGSGPCPGAGRIYAPETAEIDRDMGAIPAALLARPGRVRGRHPLDSFTAAGPLAEELILTQSPSEPYAPLAALGRAGGFVLLMGVGLERMTLLHLAEKEAGRALFRRWANDARGEPEVVEVGGCSEGFGKLEPHLRAVTRQTTVGQSAWRLLPAGDALSLAAAAVRAEPRITHCGRAECERCDDAVAGGPIL